MKSKRYLWSSPKRSYLLNKSVKSVKKVLKVLESVRKSPQAENPQHAETNQATRNVNTLAIAT